MWLFFENAIPAALARRLGSHLLTEAMEHRPDIGLDSYDRLLPNQDRRRRTDPRRMTTQILDRNPSPLGAPTFGL